MKAPFWPFLYIVRSSHSDGRTWDAMTTTLEASEEIAESAREMGHGARVYDLRTGDELFLDAQVAA